MLTAAMHSSRRICKLQLVQVLMLLASDHASTGIQHHFLGSYFADFQNNATAQNWKMKSSTVIRCNRSVRMLEPLCHPLQRVTGVAIIA